MTQLATNPGECPHCGLHHDNHEECAEADDGDDGGE